MKEARTDPEARVQLVESYVTLDSGATYWTNPVTEVVVGEGAWVGRTHLRLP